MTYPWRHFELQESSTTAALSHESQQYFFSVHLILQVLSTDKTLEVGKVIISGQLTWWFFAVPSAQQWCAMGGWSQLVEAQESLLRHLFPTTPSVTAPEGIFTIQKWQMHPGLHGSVGWALSCESKGCWLISGHGTCQGCRLDARWETYRRQLIDVLLSHRCFSPFPSKNQFLKNGKGYKLVPSFLKASH